MDYARMHQAITKLGGTRVLEGQWLIPALTLEVIWAALSPLVGQGDALLVQEQVYSAAWTPGRLLISDAEMEALYAHAVRRAA